MRPTRYARVRRLASILAVFAALAGSGLQADDANAARAGISITSPSGDGKVSGTTNVRATARNAAVLEKVTFRVDGRTVGTDRRPPYEYALDTERLAPGLHTLKVTGHETDGSRGSAQIIIQVTRGISDADGPMLKVPGSFHRPLAGSVPIVVEASDPSGVDRVEFLVDGELRWTERKAPYVLNGDRGTWETALDSDGPHALEVRAHDGAGNLTTTRTEVVVANDVPTPDPTAAIPEPEPEPARAPAPVPVQVAPPPGSATPTPTPITTPQPPPAPTPAPAPASPPDAVTGRTVAISAPADGGTVSGSTPFLATVSDADDLERVELFADGSLVATETTAPFGFGGGDGVPEFDLSSHPAGALELRAVAHFDDETAAEAAVSVEVVAAAPPTPAPPPPAPDPDHDPGPPAGAATWFVAPDGSDAGPGTEGAPFRTLDRAYRAASAGQVVEIAGGGYPKQIIEADASKWSESDVVFRPSAGASVALAYLDIHARHLEVRDVSTNGFYVRAGAEDVTLRRVESSSGGFITEADRISLIDGEIFGADSFDGLQIKADGTDEPSDLLIDGMFIHDITRLGNPNAHTECVQFTAGVGVTIRNSRFVDCSTQGVFFKEGLGGQIADVLIENNWFGRLEGYNSLILDDGVSDVLVRNNSFAKAPRLGSGVGTSNLRAIGNAGVLWSCGSGVTYRDNVWSDTACGTGDEEAGPLFVDADGFDLRLAAGSPAIDHATTADAPATDIFGTARPMGGAPDAGAHERE